LRWCRLFLRGQPVEQRDKRLVGGHRLWRETGKATADIARLEGLVGADCTGQEALTERTPRHEANPKLCTNWQHLRL
jgi:hypothetical protein